VPEGKEQASTKSERSAQDSQAPMGMGATDTVGRMLASLGKLSEVPAHFEPAMDVPNGGVLLSLPALLSNGLLQHTDRFFRWPAGYYGIASIFLLVAMMALCRLKQPESLRYCAPGEWGKLLGLDRIPEVRTLRKKLSLLSNGEVSSWGAQLCQDWMQANPEAAGVLYVDGHVRVYHGAQTELPRHYVARERLCLRATVDYWVNAMDGQPFFLVNQAVDPGLVQVVSQQIIPRLLVEVPEQPCEQQLAADPRAHRFTLVFDREGYSPEFFLQCKQQRIACLTYHKYPEADWSPDEFTEYATTTRDGHPLVVKLAERGVRLSNGLWVRQVRKLSDSGHQIAIVSTDYTSDLRPIAARMFGRWSQENFFRYMRQHFNLDRLIDYQTEDLVDTLRVVNPDWRRLDGQVRTKVGTLNHKLAQFGAMQLHGDIEPKRVERYEQAKAELQQQISCLQAEIEQLKLQRKDSPHHIQAAQLPEKERFRRLKTQTKDFVDTIKMIAYRAETAMAHILREKMSRLDDARSLLRQLYCTEADLLPDLQAATLTIRLHHMANHSADLAIRHLCDELNATATLFPGTNLRLVYGFVSDQIPPGQEL
jgi:prepilin-type processing-associated H-X9-DG protein